MKSLTTALLLISINTFAQHHQNDKDVQDSHLSHIMASRSTTSFIENLPPPKIMEGVGRSDLKINTTSELAQKYFSQGVALLHCFWDFEAIRAFKEAIRHDTTAIMPYWGLRHALELVNQDEFVDYRKFSVEKLKELAGDASEHEKLYVDGILDQDSTDAPEGYIKKLETIVHRFPEDVDAKLFLALMKMSGYDADIIPNDGTIYSEYLLRDLLRSNPDHHGVHHYWIHQMENCCPEEALKSADKLASLAPKSGHIVHMPGHIYYKLGKYEKAHNQFIKAMKVDSTYMQEQGIPEVDTWNYIHNLNYFLASCSQNGRYKEGLYYANKLANLPYVKERPKMHRGTFFYQGIITPPIMEMRFGRWGQAVQRFEAISYEDSVFGKSAMTYKSAFQYYAAGRDALQKNKPDKAKAYLDKLDALLWRNSLQDDENKLGIFSVKTLNVASVELEGCIKVAEDKLDQAIDLLEKAADMEKALGYSEPPYYPRPVLITLASVYVKQKQHDKAIECYNLLLDKHPNSSWAYWGLANVYTQMGDRKNSQKFKDKFNNVIRFGDKSLYSH